MLKKLMLLVSCVSLLALIACGEDGEQGAIVELEPSISINVPNEFDFSIEIMNDETFAELEKVEYELVNYGLLYGAFITEGLNLRFNFPEPVTDFSIISVVFLEDGTFAKTGILYEVGDLGSESPLIITHYMGHGGMPVSGFSFTDSEGNNRWYIFEIDEREGGIIWYPFDWSHDYDLYEVNEEIEEEIEEIAFSPGSEEGEFTFFLERLSDEDLGLLNQVQLYDYSQNVDDLDFGMNVAFNFNQAVTDFAIITIGFNDSEDGLNFVQTGTLFTIGDVRPREPIVLTRYRTAGTLPISGFTFTDPAGTTRWFAFQESQKDGSILWTPFHWDSSYGSAIWEDGYHEVVAGETLFSISQAYEITPDILQQLNELDSDEIYVGQLLRLPGNHGRWIWGN